MHKNFLQICVYFTPILYIVILGYGQPQPSIIKDGIRTPSITTEMCESIYIIKKSTTYFLTEPLFDLFKLLFIETTDKKTYSGILKSKVGNKDTMAIHIPVPPNAAHK